MSGGTQIFSIGQTADDPELSLGDRILVSPRPEGSLAPVYAGAALPILLIFSLGGWSFRGSVTSEVVAAEVVATLVGSIGLIAAVPVTTGIAAFLASRLEPAAREGEGEGAHAH